MIIIMKCFFALNLAKMLGKMGIIVMIIDNDINRNEMMEKRVDWPCGGGCRWAPGCGRTSWRRRCRTRALPAVCPAWWRAGRSRSAPARWPLIDPPTLPSRTCRRRRRLSLLIHNIIQFYIHQFQSISIKYPPPTLRLHPGASFGCQIGLIQSTRLVAIL